jgi:hypothetical protein
MLIAPAIHPANAAVANQPMAAPTIPAIRART